MSQLEHLVEQHVLAYESRLKHVDELVEQARNSDPNAFKSVYDDKALDLLIDRRERDEDLFNVLVGNDQARVRVRVADEHERLVARIG